MSGTGLSVATVRENWRVALLVVLLVGSAGWLLFPSTATDGPTNLKYGLELSGGTRVRAPFVGVTAQGVDFGGMNTSEVRGVEETVAADLGLPRSDVQARPGLRAFEVYSDDVSETAVADALGSAGLSVSPDDVRDGVTEPTRETSRRVIQQKLRESPRFTGGRVQLVETATGGHFLLLEVPNANSSEVRDLVETRGVVQLVAVFPADGAGGPTTPTPTPAPNATPTATSTNGTATPTANPTTSPTTAPTASPTGTPSGGPAPETGYEPPEGYRMEALFTQEQLSGIGQATEAQDGTTFVPVTLTDSAGQEFTDGMNAWGFTGPGVDNCRWRTNKADPGYCLMTVRDGNVVYAASLAPGLADQVRSGEFTKTNSFQMLTTNISEARSLRVDLQAGALPTELAIESEGTVRFVEPSLANRFKVFSLITGIIAAIAVAAVIFARYRDARVAAPMTVTALSEVLILLGVAAAIRLPLDLAHIAGFIAVIGTGVDDLVIIADEVMAEGDVRTRRVFQDRFRKAFWVIGAAAVTTIIAMSPLTVLSLGDLSGFAIVTILGVIIGVLITRPAYGDILRALVTRRD